MKATSRFLPRASSPLSVEGPSARMSPLTDLLAGGHDGPLVDAGVLVGALELGQLVDLLAEGLVLDRDEPRRLTSTTSPSSVAMDHVGGVAGGAGLDAGADVGRLGPDQRHGLRCMLAPMSARLASSCSRNGMSAVPPTRSAGRDVHELDLARGTVRMSVVAPKKTSRSSCRRRSSSEAACGRAAHEHALPLKVPSALRGVLAWATTYSSSSSAAR
jgi:hypothetical protein